MTAKAENRAGEHERQAVLDLYGMPFADLMYRAMTVHRAHWDQGEVQLSHLISVKTGGCPEDCAYCGQSARYETGIEATKLMAAAEVLPRAQSRDNSAVHCLLLL